LDARRRLNGADLGSVWLRFDESPPRRLAGALEHDPKKCKAAFRKDHAPNKNPERDLIAL